jgi:hypothetical protein
MSVNTYGGFHIDTQLLHHSKRLQDGHLSINVVLVKDPFFDLVTHAFSASENSIEE